MCGRYAIKTIPEAMQAAFGYEDRPNFPPRYNIAPTQPVPVVTIDQGRRRFVLMRWGFIPGWVKDPKDFPLVFNIRSEGAREKPSFRAAFTRRRALMPADAFYEWKTEGKVKTPYMARRPDSGLFAFPALWETWTSPDGSEMDTAALITGPAEGPMAAIHHRSPVILDPANWNEWLDPETTAERAEALLSPPLQIELELVPIGPAIGRVANDGPEVQRPAGETVAAPAADAVPKRTRSAKADKGGQGSLF
ncbi:SOS response-associated peptidase [Phreatobacter sp.]|uniref:SOS response-associated peptidase n=1 Tax=Phreatobacter sp. TaxID=1966341 RepID=UPI003F70A11E